MNTNVFDLLIGLGCRLCDEGGPQRRRGSASHRNGGNGGPSSTTPYNADLRRRSLRDGRARDSQLRAGLTAQQNPEPAIRRLGFRRVHRGDVRSNDFGKMDEKRRLHGAAGAEEVWVVDDTNDRKSPSTLPSAPNSFRMPCSNGEDSGSGAGMNRPSSGGASCDRECSAVYNDLRQTV